jgi:hypothetical protein
MENRTLEARSFIAIYPSKLKSVPRPSRAGRAGLGNPCSRASEDEGIGEAGRIVLRTRANVRGL